MAAAAAVVFGGGGGGGDTSKLSLTTFRVIIYSFSGRRAENVPPYRLLSLISFLPSFSLFLFSPASQLSSPRMNTIYNYSESSYKLNLLVLLGKSLFFNYFAKLLARCTRAKKKIVANFCTRSSSSHHYTFAFGLVPVWFVAWPPAPANQKGIQPVGN